MLLNIFLENKEEILPGHMTKAPIPPEKESPEKTQNLNRTYVTQRLRTDMDDQLE